MFTTERELKYDVSDAIRPPLFEQTADEMQNSTLSDNQLLLGATLRTATGFGRTATVKAGEDIRPALDSLKSAGGGTLILLAGVHKPTYDIAGGTSINIVGEGIGATVIDFGASTAKLIYENTEPSVFDDLMGSFRLGSFTVQNSANTTGAIQILGCRDFRIDNIESKNNTGHGFYLRSNWYFGVSNCIADNNTKDGVHVTSSTVYPKDTSDFTLLNITSNDNTGHGISLDALSGFSNLAWGIFGCFSSGNGDDGFSIGDSSGNAAVIYGSIYGCSAASSTNWHYDFDAPFCTVVGCTNSNGSDTFRFGANSSGSIAGCSGSDYSIHADANVSIVGAFSKAPDTIGAPDIDIPSVDTHSTVVGTMGGSTTTERTVLQMLNNSGSTINAGEVVILDSVADGDQVDRTTTQGDDLVFGMMLTTRTSTTTVYASVVTEGLTNILKVDGTTDIAVGDFLGTFTTAGIAMKAAVGDMAFAIALEAYTTDDSSGIIDALLIKPRKI